MLFAGLGLAVGAALLFNGGVALQAVEARDAPSEQALRFSLVWGLLKRKRWLLGVALNALGFPLEAAAFAVASFVVVQPTLASGLLFLLVLGALTLGERVRRGAVAGVVAIVLGIALVAGGAPHRHEVHRSVWVIVSLIGVLSALALVPFALRALRWQPVAVTTVAAGVGFAVTNITTKLLADAFGAGAWWAFAAWLAVAAALGIVATVTQMTALQEWQATTVVPITFALQSFLPIVVEPLFLRESWGSLPLAGAPLAAGLVLALAGTVLVARAPGVSKLAAGG